MSTPPPPPPSPARSRSPSPTPIPYKPQIFTNTIPPSAPRKRRSAVFGILVKILRYLFMFAAFLYSPYHFIKGYILWRAILFLFFIEPAGW